MESMMTIQIHILSVFIGYVCGAFITLIVVCHDLFDNRWHIAFGRGFDAGWDSAQDYECEIEEQIDKSKDE